MQTELKVTYHGMSATADVEERIKQRTERLEQHFGRIIGCRVVVDAPHQHHRKGNAYAVRIEVRVPGGEFVVDRKPGDVHAHFDVMVALRDSFDAIERQLRRWKDEHSGRPIAQAEPLQGRIAELHRERDHGQIATTDGRLVYFHRNSVLDSDFEALNEGDSVELVVDQGVGEGGPHASSVRVISTQRFVDKP